MTLNVLTWDTLDALGFDREERPDDNLRTLPRDVTTLDSRALMSLFSHYTEWGCYAAYRLAWAETRVTEVKQTLKVVTNQAALRADEKTITARKAAASLDSDVQDAEQQLLTAEALATALRMVLANSNDRRTLVSRELSRRQAEAQVAGRDPKWTT